MSVSSHTITSPRYKCVFAASFGHKKQKQLLLICPFDSGLLTYASIHYCKTQGIGRCFNRHGWFDIFNNKNQKKGGDLPALSLIFYRIAFVLEWHLSWNYNSLFLMNGMYENKYHVLILMLKLIFYCEFVFSSNHRARLY